MKPNDPNLNPQPTPPIVNGPETQEPTITIQQTDNNIPSAAPVLTPPINVRKPLIDLIPPQLPTDEARNNKQNRLIHLAPIFLLIIIVLILISSLEFTSTFGKKIQTNDTKKTTTTSSSTAKSSATNIQTSTKQPTVTKPPVEATQSQPNQSSTSSSTAPTSNNSTSPPITIPLYTSGNFTYYWAGGRQYATASGASVDLSQDQPTVTQTSGSENHSLMEMSVEDTAGKQIVEVGWMVDQVLFNNALPHLFVYHWVDGQTSCYNGCGFVQVSSTNVPGESLTVGATGNFEINYTNNAWYIYYNGDTLGYFPSSLWSGTFTQAGFIETFGEVETSSSTCIEMGDGIAGTSPGSAQISNFTLLGSSTAADLGPYQTASSNYSYGSLTPDGLTIGGSGPC
jgi:hypothetical protein